MIPWQKAPFFRLAIMAACGVLCSEWVTFTSGQCFAISLIFIGFVVFTLISKKGQIAGGISLLFSVFILFAGFHRNAGENSLERIDGEKVVVFGLVDQVMPRKKYLRIVIDVLGTGDSLASLERNKGKLLMYYKGEDSIFPGINDTVIIEGKVSRIGVNTNPHAFNYGEYMRKKGVFYQCFAEKFISIKSRKISFTRSAISEFQDRSRVLLHKYLADSVSRGIVSAMVMGDREFLPENVNKSFTDSGAIHTLAVSGLHVGIVASLIMMIFKFFPSKRKVIHFIYFLISAGFVWGFAIFAGGRPSVVRASVMFTLFMFDFYVSGHRNSYNFLAFAALVILIVDPYAIYDLGFQFSFLALLGILLFYRPIRGLWPHKKIKFIDYAWDLVAVSISAQIAVAPLSIYYFHQFPVYFWLSSLWAIPWTYVIVLSGILFLVFGGISDLAGRIMGSILDECSELLTTGINWVNALPFGQIANVWLEWPMVILFYLIVGYLLVYIYFHKYWAFNIFLICIFIGYFSSTIRDHRLKEKTAITIYDAGPDHLIDIIDGRRVFTFKSKDLDELKESYIAEGNRRFHRINDVKEITEASILSEGNLFFREGIAILKNKVIYFPSYGKTSFRGKIDLMILTRDCKLDLEEVVRDLSPQKIIIDKSFHAKPIELATIIKINPKVEICEVRYSGAININW